MLIPRSLAWRNPTEEEKAVVAFLLSCDFQGKEAIRAQILERPVRTVEDNYGIEFHIESPAVSMVSGVRVPIEAVAELGGRRVHALLFVNDDGLVYLLEFFAEDGDPLTGLPPAGSWRLPW